MDRVRAKRRRWRRRKAGIRKRVMGTGERPRMTVYRSLRHVYVQLVDDFEGRTLVSASTRDQDAPAENAGNARGAAEVGRRLAERARAAGITRVVFDRNGFRFHGRVKALAEAAREGGLEF